MLHAVNWYFVFVTCNDCVLKKKRGVKTRRGGICILYLSAL